MIGWRILNQHGLSVQSVDCCPFLVISLYLHIFWNALYIDLLVFHTLCFNFCLENWREREPKRDVVLFWFFFKSHRLPLEDLYFWWLTLVNRLCMIKYRKKEKTLCRSPVLLCLQLPAKILFFIFQSCEKWSKVQKKEKGEFVDKLEIHITKTLVNFANMEPCFIR